MIPFASPAAHAARRRWELFAIAVVAIALRVGVFLVATGPGHVTLAAYIGQGDTTSYVAYAAALSGEQSYASLAEYDRRVFPGYPALIAIVHRRTGVSLAMAALLVTWTCAGVAATAAAGAFGDARVGWAMTCLVPHYLLNSSLGMSEAPLLAAVALAAWVARDHRWVVPGLLLGAAGLIRPMGCFAAAGLAYAAWRAHRRGVAAGLLAVTGVTFAAGFFSLNRWTGDALQGVHIYANHPGAYNGHLLGWPFESLLRTPGREPTSAGRMAYVWAHVVVVLVACGFAVQRATRRRADARDAMAFPWLVGNTLFVLCIGSAWGFRHFPRFTVPAAPALFWTLRGALPRRPLLWVPIALACAVAAVSGIIYPTQ